MEKEFVPYELAVKLKALGFGEPCFGYYYTLNDKDWKFAERADYFRLDDEISIGGKFSLLAPTFSQAFRWFRENKLADGSVCRHGKADGSYSYRWDIVYEYGVYEERHFKQDYKTYEEAELACLEKLIEIVDKTKQYV